MTAVRACGEGGSAGDTVLGISLVVGGSSSSIRTCTSSLRHNEECKDGHENDVECAHIVVSFPSKMVQWSFTCRTNEDEEKDKMFPFAERGQVCMLFAFLLLWITFISGASNPLLGTRQWYRRLLFIDHVTRKDVEMALRVLDDQDFDPSFDQNWALRTASKIGLLDLVARLLSDSRVDPSAKNCSAFRNCYRHAQPVYHSSKSSMIRGMSAGALMDGIGGKSIIMKMILAHPKTPPLSKMSHTSVPLSIMMVALAHDMVKSGDVEGFKEYMRTRDQDFTFPAMLEWALMAAPLHSHYHLYAEIILKFLSMKRLSTRYAEMPRLQETHHWIHQLYEFFKGIKTSGCLDTDCLREVLTAFLAHSAHTTSQLIYR